MLRVLIMAICESFKSIIQKSSRNQKEVNRPITALQEPRTSSSSRERPTSKTDALRSGEPPHLNWSTVIFRKRRTKNDKQASKARRDCVEVTAS